MAGQGGEAETREPEAGLTGLQRLRIKVLHSYFRLVRGMTLGVRAAVVNEVREELLISLTGPAQLFGVYFNRKVSRRDHVALYVVRDFTVDEPKKPDMEIAEARFFPLDALPDGLTPATRRRLMEVVQGVPPAVDW